MGISFRRAHHIVARLVRIAIEKGKGSDGVNSQLVDKAAEEMLGFHIKLDDDVIRRAIDPVEFVKTRITKRSVNLEKVAAIIAYSKSKLEEDIAWFNERELRKRESSDKRSRAARAILSSYG